MQVTQIEVVIVDFGDLNTHMEDVMADPRHRERDEVPKTCTGTLFCSKSYFSPSEKTQICSTGKEVMDDVVVQGYHQRIRDGEVISNPCDYTRNTMRFADEGALFKFTETADTTHYHYSDQGYNLTKYLLDAVGVAPGVVPTTDNWSVDPDMSNADRDAQAFAYADIDSTPYDFFEDVAEISETINFIRKPLHALKDVAKAYKKAKRAIERKARRGYPTYREAKALAALWNQYRFAASPLLRSILQGMDAFNNRHNIHRNSRRTAHGFGGLSPTSESSDHETFSGSGATECVFTFKKTLSRVEARSHAAILYEVTNPLKNWQFALGLRFKDIPTVTWEVLPLSFMVDRLWSVKTAISGLVNFLDPRVKILSASITHRVTHEWKLSIDDIHYTYGHFSWQILKPDDITWTSFRYNRDEYEPQFSDIFPTVKPLGLVKNVTETIDLLSIILSLMK